MESAKNRIPSPNSSRLLSKSFRNKTPFQCHHLRNIKTILIFGGSPFFVCQGRSGPNPVVSLYAAELGR